MKANAMKLQFDRRIAAPADLVWTYLCVPDRMNTWSTARVQVVQNGQGNHPGGPGTHRRVFIKAAGRHMVLNEVIRDSEPGKSLTYQVVDNAALRSHRGTISLREETDGTHLQWNVAYECVAPGLAPLFAKVLRSQLETSLLALASVLESETPPQTVLPHWPAIPAPTEKQWRRGEEVLNDLVQLANTLDAAGDPKRIFPHIYSFVSEGILQACRRGDFVYPSWALELLPVFYEYYLRNYRRWCGPDKAQTESHWKRAFRVLDGESTRYPDAASQLLAGLVLSVHAHVESDLPRSFAEVYVDSFAETSDYGRFRGDYYCMGQIFIKAFARVQDIIPPGYLPRWARIARRLLPEELMQQVAYTKAYNLPKQRRAAFRRGEEMAELLLVRSRRANEHGLGTLR